MSAKLAQETEALRKLRDKDQRLEARILKLKNELAEVEKRRK